MSGKITHSRGDNLIEIYLWQKILLLRARCSGVGKIMEECKLFSPDEIEPFKRTREIYLNDVSRFTGFAEAFSNFGRITWLESSITKLICTSRVPPRETRKLLRCRSPEQAVNVPVVQFMKGLFGQIGFDLKLESIKPFQIVFRVRPPIYESPVKQRKTCYTMAEAIYRFFTKDLGLDCKVFEGSCINEGAVSCDFVCVLDFLATAKAALESGEKELVRMLARGMGSDDIRSAGGFEEGELEFRLDVLRDYGIIDGGGGLTEKGRELNDAIADEKEVDFEPPWSEVRDMTETISTASSFAEAIKEGSVDKDRRKKHE